LAWFRLIAERVSLPFPAQSMGRVIIFGSLTGGDMVFRAPLLKHH
jgi:hypothetical protein